MPEYGTGGQTSDTEPTRRGVRIRQPRAEVEVRVLRPGVGAADLGVLEVGRLSRQASNPSSMNFFLKLSIIILRLY